MRQFLTVLIACLLGLAAAFAFGYVADLMRPCRGEGLACSMTQIVGLIYIPVFSAVALIAFSIAVFWKGSARALNVAALLPLALFLGLVTFIKWSEIAVREFHEIRERDIQELLQVVSPIVLTLIVPWIALLRLAGRTETGKTSHG